MKAEANNAMKVNPRLGDTFRSWNLYNKRHQRTELGKKGDKLTGIRSDRREFLASERLSPQVDAACNTSKLSRTTLTH